MPPGRYECEPRRADGEWQFHNRLVILDALFALPSI
jgi:hypothetical protein